MKTAAIQRDIRQEVTEAIIQLLEQSLNFENSWHMVANEQPCNPITGTKYKGINFLFLSAVASLRGYTVNRWLTFNEIKQLQSRIKKGEKASFVCYYSTYEKDVINQAGEVETEQRRVLRYYNVFNVAQVEGLPSAFYEAPETPIMEQWQKDDAAETLITATNARIEYVKGNKAFYNPMSDKITLPIREQFKGAEPFYSTAFHEIVHWTGAAHRLNREKGGKFGDTKYAYEELIAELGAAYLCAHLGFDKEITNNAAYIKSWLGALKNDKSFIFKATAEASAAADFILSFSQQPA
jgi:antirestriction protein ArdC